MVEYYIHHYAYVIHIMLDPNKQVQQAWELHKVHDVCLMYQTGSRLNHITHEQQYVLSRDWCTLNKNTLMCIGMESFASTISLKCIISWVLHKQIDDKLKSLFVNHSCTTEQDFTYCVTSHANILLYSTVLLLACMSHAIIATTSSAHWSMG